MTPCNCTGACLNGGQCPVATNVVTNLVCQCTSVWGSILPPPPCRVHDTVPIQLVVCEHTDSPWCPRCAGGLQ